MRYEDLLIKLDELNIEVVEKKLAGNLKALYCDDTIFIDYRMSDIEKKCILVEELGHHFKNFGDILDKRNVNCVKQENIGRRWGYEYLVPFDQLRSIKNNCDNIYELAEKLDVTLEFLEEAIEYYEQKYGSAI